VTASVSTLSCTGSVAFPITAYVGTYKLTITGFANLNNASLTFTQSGALTVVS
jgi:hypothetical protein